MWIGLRGGTDITATGTLWALGTPKIFGAFGMGAGWIAWLWKFEIWDLDAMNGFGWTLLETKFYNNLYKFLAF